MARDGSETGLQRRLAEMDERLRTLQAALERDAGVEGAPSPPDAGGVTVTRMGAGPERPRRSKRAPRIFPPQPKPQSQPEPEPESRPELESQLESQATPADPPAPSGAESARPESPAPPEPARSMPAGAPESGQPVPPAAAASQLEAMCARLLRASQELLAGYELALAHAATTSGGASAVTLSVGPFHNVAALESFQASLRGMPDVAEVAVRGYEGNDRAILEVQLRG